MTDETQEPENNDPNDMWAEALQEQENAEQTEDQDTERGISSDDWAAAMSEEAPISAEDSAQDASNIAVTELTSLDEQLTQEIDVEVRIELGRTRLPLKKVYELNQGSVIELSKDSKQPLDVYINNLLLLKGEVVTVKDNFGLLITEKIDKRERAKNLSFTHESK